MRKRNICTVEGCDHYVRAHGLCTKHDARLRSHGSTSDFAHIKADVSLSLPVDTHELAWAAGFFDGEGHTGFVPPEEPSSQRPNGKRARVGITIGQSDRRPLDRFATAVGAPGHIYGPRKMGNSVKLMWYYHFYRFEGVQHIIASLWKYLSQEKRAQASHALQSLREERVLHGLAR